ncbi:hypothetical protein [Nocardia sp. NPDC052112]|uniref:hypothetical protein n=1 Tax=Nocardia sp. NPDC052112 TaxID=3155646 RepID=UPI00343D19E6
MLTEQQIKMTAGLAGWRTRQALANLTGRALVVTTLGRRGRYQITQLGRNTLATKAIDFGQLEV